MSNVKVLAIKNDSAELFFQTKKADLVSFRIGETAIVTDSNGFMKEQVRTDFVKINKTLAEKLVAAGKLKVGVPYANLIGQDCKIVVKESHNPFYPGQDHKINPTTKEAVTKDGKLIYSKGFLTTDLSISDELIQHDRTPVNSAIKANSDFAKAGN